MSNYQALDEAVDRHKLALQEALTALDADPAIERLPERAMKLLGAVTACLDDLFTSVEAATGALYEMGEALDAIAAQERETEAETVTQEFDQWLHWARSSTEVPTTPYWRMHE